MKLDNRYIRNRKRTSNATYEEYVKDCMKRGKGSLSRQAWESRVKNGFKVDSSTSGKFMSASLSLDTVEDLYAIFGDGMSLNKMVRESINRMKDAEARLGRNGGE